MASLASDAANRKTFELVAEQGATPDDLEPLFAALDPDQADAIDGVHDEANMPLPQEPTPVRNDLEAVARRTVTANKRDEREER